jgi:hypothetical protein
VWHSRLGCLIATLILLACVAASATTIEPLSVEDMTQRATQVVEGRATALWSAWDENEHLIYTYTRFSVARALKGAAQSEVVVRQMGGSAGGYHQHVSGVESFALGEEAVLFLRPSTRAGSYAIVGLVQGNFRIRRDASGAAQVSNGVAQVETLERGRTGTFSGAHMSLGQLEQRVRGAVGQ